MQRLILKEAGAVYRTITPYHLHDGQPETDSIRQGGAVGQV